MTHVGEIWRYETGKPVLCERDDLAEEEPLEIRVKGRPVSVTMRTPGHDEELAAGFLLTEGIIQNRADLLRIEPCAHARIGNIVNAVLAPGVSVDFDRLTRHVFASSSCGLCGKAAIESVCHKVEPIDSSLEIDAATLLALPDRLREAQAVFDRTGGLHGVGLFGANGDLLLAREDVGRHNALDKVLGRVLFDGLLPLNAHVLMLSGRVSFEIMQKALCARVPIIAAVSAPSSLAVDFARDSGQTLVGFLRSRRMNVYAGAQRVRFP